MVLIGATLDCLIMKGLGVKRESKNDEGEKSVGVVEFQSIMDLKLSLLDSHLEKICLR